MDGMLIIHFRSMDVVISLSPSFSVIFPTMRGGELTFQLLQGSKEIRLPAGHIILYPSSSLHCVRPVVSGARLVCVGWIESYIQSTEDRSILFNLDAGAKGLLARHGRSDELDLIFQSYANAVRRFSGG